MDASVWMPHASCFSWNRWLLIAYAASNLIIFCSYLAIPITIAILLQRVMGELDGDIPQEFRAIATLFMAFIASCGVTHAIDIFVLWVPAYWLDAASKSVTAVISFTTALYFPAAAVKGIRLALESELNQVRLMRELQKVKLFIEQGPFAAYIKDEQSRIRWYNRYICRKFGITEKDWIGKTDVEIYLDKESANAIMENDRIIRASGVPQDFIEITTTVEGRREWFSTKFPFDDPISKASFIGGVSLDVTEKGIAHLRMHLK